MAISHPNPDPSFHHEPFQSDCPRPHDTTTSTTTTTEPVPTTTSTTTSVVDPTPSHIEPTPSHTSHTHSAPTSGAVDSTTPASTTSRADPSVASDASSERKQGVEGAPAAENVGGDAGVSGPEGGAGEKGEGGYPPQSHAGKLGLGPSYNTGGGIADTLAAKGEILKGKITHNEALVQQGHDRQSGKLQQQYHAEQAAKDEDESPFTRPDDGATKGNPQPNEGLGAKGTSEQEVRESGHAASASAGTAGTKSE